MKHTIFYIGPLVILPGFTFSHALLKVSELVFFVACPGDIFVDDSDIVCSR
jgi:hypothetical protein